MRSLMTLVYRVVGASAIVLLIVYAATDATLMLGGADRIHQRVPPELIQPASAKK